MSFPWHYRPWRETAEFVGPRVRDGDRVLAPDQFWSVVTRVDRYVPANLVSGTSYDWVVLDTDDMAQIPRPFLEDVAARMTPVFVNDQFVVWHAADTHEPDAALRDGLARFWAHLAKLGPEPAEPNRCLHDRALADAPRITRLSEVADVELRAAMNDLHRRTGYRFPTLRDRTYHEELRGHIRDVLGRHESGLVLDIASGSEDFVDLPQSSILVRTDVAEVGVELARGADGSREDVTYVVTDASRVAFADATFDAVLFTDAIEHVRDAGRVLQEARRVLRPGGELLVTFANRNSVNQVLTEKLGFPRFPTNHQHFRELTLAEIRELLDEAGLEITETAGVALYPYWAVPGVDEIVRKITDDDPEFVAMMAELGRRAGAEYAYTGVVFRATAGGVGGRVVAQLVVTSMGAPPTVVFLVPIAPAPTGNGLAMRAGMLLDSLAGAGAVHLVVVPVSGSADDCSWAAARARSVTVVPPVTAASARDHLTRQLADPTLRARLAATSPLPTRAALAPPTLAAEVVAALPGEIGRPHAVLAMRTYLAPLGITLARLLGAPRVVIDADDDDAALLRELGELDEAGAFERLARCWLPDATAVFAASAIDAASLARSVGLDAVGVVPNALDTPGSVPAPPGVGRLLFVGNLTYEPNVAASMLLADEILPAVRERHPNATLDVVGPHDARLARVAEIPGVRLTGRVPEVGPFYAGADVVVVPLRHGAGTRIKVLEAFVHRRPVVATPVAVAGLEVEPGREVVVAEAVDALAGAVGDLLDEPDQAAALVEAAAAFVAARHSPAAVGPIVRAAILGTHADHDAGGTSAP